MGGWIIDALWVLYSRAALGHAGNFKCFYVAFVAAVASQKSSCIKGIQPFDFGQSMRALSVLLVFMLAACAQSPDSTVTTVGRLSTGPDGISPNGLTGLNSLLVETALGSPAFARNDRDAKIWQYRSNACILDLYLYEDGNAWQVAHWAMRGPKAGDPKGCLAEVTRRS